MRKIILILLLVVISGLAGARARAQETNLFWNEEYETVHDDFEACYETIVKSNPQKFELVKHMANVIYNYKWRHDGEAWIECGHRIKSETKAVKRAWTYAWYIVDASEKVSDKHYTLIPWSLTAIMANESVFDRCALGPTPRKWAYRKKLLKKRSILSHYENDVVNVVTSKAAKRAFEWSGFDLGPCQLLSRFYSGNILDMMQIDKGVMICAQEAYDRGRLHAVKQPQILWPNGDKNSQRAKKYRRWVNSRLRRWGVTTKELFDDNLYYNSTKTTVSKVPQIVSL